MRTLAPKFGLSDVGLAKVCKRMRIPRPGLGYWAKKAAGQPVKPAQLPVVLQSAGPAVLEFVPHEPRSQDEVPVQDSSQPPNASQLKRPPIPVAKSLRRRHPDVERTAQIFRNLKPGLKGLLATREKGCLPLKVAPRTLPRALRIADAICKECETRGYRIAFGGVEYGSSVPRCRIMRDQDAVSWLLEEEFEKVPHVPTPKELLEKAKYSWHRIPAYEHLAVGNLALRILDGSWGTGSQIRRSWIDRKRQRVEDSLNAFFDAVVRGLEIEKQHRLEREEDARRRLEEQGLAAEREERRRKELARIQDLDTKLVAWTRRRDLRTFLAAVEEQASARGIAADSPLAAWIDWARGHADATDPLRAHDAGDGAGATPGQSSLRENGR